MKVVIIGSLSSEERIEQARKVFLDLGCSVVTPFEEGMQDRSLFYIQQRFHLEMKSADLVVVVPKLDAWEAEAGSQTKYLVFGESTCYEIAVAVNEEIPLVYWPMQGTFIFPKFQPDGECNLKREKE